MLHLTINLNKRAISDEMLKISEANDIIKNNNWRVYPIKQNELYENGVDEKLRL